MKRLSYLSIVILFLLLGCHFSTKYENRDSDRQDAERVTLELFTPPLPHESFRVAIVVVIFYIYSKLLIL